MLERSNNESEYAILNDLCMLLRTDHGNVSRLLHDLGNPSICSPNEDLLTLECCLKKKNVSGKKHRKYGQKKTRALNHYKFKHNSKFKVNAIIIIIIKSKLHRYNLYINHKVTIMSLKK